MLELLAIETNSFNGLFSMEAPPIPHTNWARLSHAAFKSLKQYKFNDTALKKGSALTNLEQLSKFIGGMSSVLHTCC